MPLNPRNSTTHWLAQRGFAQDATGKMNFTAPEAPGLGTHSSHYPNINGTDLLVAAKAAFLADGYLTQLTVPIPVINFRVWDSLTNFLPQTAADDDLAIIEGSLGTSMPVLQGAAASGASVTSYGAIMFPLPIPVALWSTCTLRINAEETVGAATVSTTVDAQMYRGAAPTVDICATAAIDVTGTAGNKDFTITPTNIVDGDYFFLRIATIANDTGGTVGTVAQINSVSLVFA